jgi:hypothetical protein
VIIPDRDPPPNYPGQRHAADIARSLRGKAASVRVLELPQEKNGRPVKDFSDWQAADGTKDELLQLAENAPDGPAWLATWQDRLASSSPMTQGKGNRSQRNRRGPKATKAEAQPPAPPPDPEQVARSKEEARVAAGDLWTAPDVLERFYRAAVAKGIVGEECNVKVLILAVTSRTLERPVNVYLHSESSSGKTYLARCVLDLFPPEASLQFDGSSAKAFVYDDSDYRHRVLLLNEVDAFATARVKDADNAGVGLLRNLADSPVTNYNVAVKNEDGGGFHTQKVRKEGPAGLILTGCHSIDPELTNRCVVLSLDESAAQTRAIKLVKCRKAAGKAPAAPALARFHGLQRYLQLTAPSPVVIPFAEHLPLAGKGDTLRSRRDIVTLLTLVAAHALLHVGTRGHDAQGRLVATPDDYRAVYRIAAAVFEAEDTGLTGKQREAVAAVRAPQRREARNGESCWRAAGPIADRGKVAAEGR